MRTLSFLLSRRLNRLRLFLSSFFGKYDLSHEVSFIASNLYLDIGSAEMITSLTRSIGSAEMITSLTRSIGSAEMITSLTSSISSAKSFFYVQMTFFARTICIYQKFFVPLHSNLETTLDHT